MNIDYRDIAEQNRRKKELSKARIAEAKKREELAHKRYLEAQKKVDRLKRKQKFIFFYTFKELFSDKMISVDFIFIAIFFGILTFFEFNIYESIRYIMGVEGVIGIYISITCGRKEDYGGAIWGGMMAVSSATPLLGYNTFSLVLMFLTGTFRINSIFQKTISNLFFDIEKSVK